MGNVTQRAGPPGAPANAKLGCLWPAACRRLGREANRPARRRGSAGLCVLRTRSWTLACRAAVCHMTRDVRVQYQGGRRFWAPEWRLGQGRIQEKGTVAPHSLPCHRWRWLWCTLRDSIRRPRALQAMCTFHDVVASTRVSGLGTHVGRGGRCDGSSASARARGTAGACPNGPTS